MANITNIIIREVANLVINLFTDDMETFGIFPTIVFGAEALVILGVYVIYLIVSIMNSKKKPASCFNTIMTVTQIFASLLYFYGNNIGYVLERYNEDIGCGEQCVYINRVAAISTLGLSLILFAVIPKALGKIRKMNEWEYRETRWSSALESILVIVGLDALFTLVVVAVMDQTYKFCETFTIVGFIFVLVVMVFYSLHLYRKRDNMKCMTVVEPFMLSVLCLPMYMLADNKQPLDCAFGCDTPTANMTEHEMDCNVTANAISRISLMLATVLFVVSLLCMLYCSNCMSPLDHAYYYEIQRNVEPYYRDPPNAEPDNKNQRNIKPDDKDQSNSESDAKDQPNAGSEDKDQSNSESDAKDQPNAGSEDKDQSNSESDAKDQSNAGSEDKDQLNADKDQSNSESDAKDQSNAESEDKDQPNAKSDAKDQPNAKSDAKDQPNAKSEDKNAKSDDNDQPNTESDALASLEDFDSIFEKISKV